MTEKTHVIINGRAYDPITGMPLKQQPSIQQLATTEPPIQSQRGATTNSIHKHHTQRSVTLSRKHLTRPVVTKSAPAQAISITSVSPKPAKHADVTRFASQPTADLKPLVRADRPAEKHPMAHRASQRVRDINTPRRQRQQTPMATKQPVAPTSTVLKPAHVLKNEAIERALAAEMKPTKQHHAKRQQSRFGRWLSLASAGLAVMLLGGYFTYLSMPNISVKVAAIQSGIDAKYPGYRPDGYALSGPIGFKNGEVSMRFAYAGTDQAYNLTQQKSSWDSSAVKEFISTKSTSQTTTTINGLTIYTYDNNAAWVNGGILYQVDGNAPLSGDQIRRIATSL